MGFSNEAHFFLSNNLSTAAIPSWKVNNVRYLNVKKSAGERESNRLKSIYNINLNYNQWHKKKPSIIVTDDSFIYLVRYELFYFSTY